MQTYLKEPLCASGYGAAFCVDVCREDLYAICHIRMLGHCKYVLSRKRRNNLKVNVLTSLQTFQLIGPSETENENAKT